MQSYACAQGRPVAIPGPLGTSWFCYGLFFAPASGQVLTQHGSCWAEGFWRPNAKPCRVERADSPPFPTRSGAPLGIHTLPHTGGRIRSLAQRTLELRPTRPVAGGGRVSAGLWRAPLGPPYGAPLHPDTSCARLARLIEFCGLPGPLPQSIPLGSQRSLHSISL